jgi:predicted ATPase
VARERELAALLSAATPACAGSGPELVTIVGPAGIGKSRLLAELADRLTASPPEAGPVAWRQGRALPYGDGPTFGALAEAVKAEAGILESDGAELAGRRLAAAAGAVAEPITAAWVAGHLRRLVGVGAGRGGAAAPTTAADREEEFAAWRRFLHGLAATRPLVLALEDLHRADDALLDFVESLADRDGGPAAVLVLATARPTTACPPRSTRPCSAGSRATLCSPRSTSACCATGARTRPPMAPSPCPPGCTRSSPPAWTPSTPPTRPCSTTPPCSARSAGWGRWPR